MKRTVSLFLLLTVFVISISAQDKELNVKSSIEAVTVFFKNAQINRKGNISLPTGDSKLLIKGLSPFIDANSIQAKIDGEVSIISVVHQKDYLGEMKASELQMAIDKLEKEKSYHSLQITINNEKESFLKENKSIGGSNTGFQLSDLREISAFYASQLKALKTETFELRIKTEQLNKEIRALRRELQETQGGSFSSSGKIIVKVKSKAPFQGKLNISYLLRNAGWMPAYDVRVKDINSPLEIALKAKLKQNTGEDWENVNLTFSNADPTQNSTLPILNPYYLGYNQVYRRSMSKVNKLISPRSIQGRVTDDSGIGIPGVNVIVIGTTSGTTTDIDGNYKLVISRSGQSLVYSFIGMMTQEVQIGSRSVIDVSMSADVMELSEVVVTGYKGASNSRMKKAKVKSFKDNIPQTTRIENQTNLEYTLNKPYSLKSGNESTSLTLTGYEAAASFEYQVIPKKQEKAYLVAQIVNWSQYDLLEAPTSLFFENTFIGKTILNTGVVSDTLEVSLGEDKNVLIKREKLKDFQKKRYIGSNITESRAWKITLRNQKKQPVKITVKDQVPVSTSSDIQVDVIELSNGKQNKTTGEVTWKLTLNPNEQRELIIKYNVKYPKSKRLVVE